MNGIKCFASCLGAKRKYLTRAVLLAGFFFGGGAMYVYVRYRNPNHWTDLDEIWQVGGP